MGQEMKAIRHVLNLDTVGGVEELFIHFLATAKRLGAQVDHHVLVTSNKPHPFFLPYLQDAASLSSEKYFGPIKLPHFLRMMRRKEILTSHICESCILWNRMERYPWPKKTIYYEHGASWIAKKTKESCDFFQSVDQILANSYAAKRLLQLKWDIKEPITIIENPLKPTITKAQAAKKAPKELRLGYIGRLIPLKGVSLIIHALEAFRGQPVSLTIAGDGPEKESLIALTKKLNLPVQFLGAIKNVESFYDTVDILIVPSIREPLGLVAQEASLRGCPIIAANVDGLPEVVQDGQTGSLITPTLDLAQYPELGGKTENLPDLVYNPQEDRLTTPRLIDPVHIAQEIKKLWQNPELFETTSQNAITFASMRPNLETYTKALLAI